MADVESRYTAIADELLGHIAENQPEDLELAVGFLKKVAKDPAYFSSFIKYKHIPVSPREFIESPSYMDSKDLLWPVVLDEFCEINSGKYFEIVLTGGIGVAKTTLALYSQAYQLYKLSCLKNPHEEFGLDPSSEILIVFQSISKELAKSVDYTRFRSMISKAPYFKAHFRFNEDLFSEMQFPNRIVVKPIIGVSSGAIGQNVISGVLDECNFMAVVEGSKQSKTNGTHDQAVDNYNAIARRRESRFMVKGEIPGLLCLVSSRNYPGQFTDIKEAEALTNSKIYVYDKRLWELQPDRFSGDTFKVFVGDATRKPYVIDSDIDEDVFNSDLVMDIPIEYRKQFDNDILNALRDIAGVSTLALHPFMIQTELVHRCFGLRKSVVSRDDCDFVNTKLKVYPDRIINRTSPRFIHVDLALTKDSAGVSMGYVDNFVDINRGDYLETLPVISFDMILEVCVPKNGEIKLENIRRLIYGLRDKLGVPIKWVSFDGFNSRDSMQLLHQHGFIVQYISVDKTTTPYDITRQAFYDGRIIAPMHTKAVKELVSLELNTKKQIVDHPPLGSKDVSDSMAGCTYGLTMLRESWITHGVSLSRIPSSLTKIKEPSAATKVTSTREDEVLC